MHILHVIHSIDLHAGGPSHVVRAMAGGQVAAGHQVSLLTTDIQAAQPRRTPEAYRQSVEADEALCKCEVHLLPAWGRRRPWSTYGYSPGARGWLGRRFADPARRPEVVHVHGVFSHVTSLAATAAARCGIPYVLRPAGILDAACLGSGRAWLKRLLLRFSLRRDLEAAAALHATSPAEARELRRWVPPEKICTIPLGVEVNGRAGPDVRERFLARFPQMRGKRVVLFLGRIAAKKRPELLVEAVARLRSDMPGLALLFAGQDDGGMAAVDAAVCDYGLAEAVFHAGFVEGDEKAGTFAASHLFALPSLDENFGIAVVEAMAHGLPALVTPGVAACRYIEASGAGLVVEGTPDAFAEGVRRILSADAAAMGRAGQQYVRQHLSWQAALASLDRLYESAMTPPRTRERAEVECQRTILR